LVEVHVGYLGDSAISSELTAKTDTKTAFIRIFRLTATLVLVASMASVSLRPSYMEQRFDSVGNRSSRCVTRFASSTTALNRNKLTCAGSGIIFFSIRNDIAKKWQGEPISQPSSICIERAAIRQKSGSSAMVFLYSEVLKKPFDWLEDVARALSLHTRLGMKGGR